MWNLNYNQTIELIIKKDYKQYEIPKKNGFRTISFLPETSSLYHLQKKFCEHYLMKQELPVCTKGFVKGENYLSYLEPHVGSKYFVRIDIKDFFPSITEEKICDAVSTRFSFDSDDDKIKILKLIADICTYQGVLPQGVPTSPMMSNLVMSRIDQRLTKYCQILNINYTRYADDLLFSSVKFDFQSKNWFLKKIRYILSSQDFRVNYSKLKYGYEQISLNGYVLSEYGIRLSRKRLLDLNRTISFSRVNHELSKTEPEVFVQKANTLILKHRDLEMAPFISIFQFTQFLAGYRAYLISFLKYDLDSRFRKKIVKLLRQLEEQLRLY